MRRPCIMMGVYGITRSPSETDVGYAKVSADGLCAPFPPMPQGVGGVSDDKSSKQSM